MPVGTGTADVGLTIPNALDEVKSVYRGMESSVRMSEGTFNTPTPSAVYTIEA